MRVVQLVPLNGNTLILSGVAICTALRAGVVIADVPSFNAEATGTIAKSLWRHDMGTQCIQPQGIDANCVGKLDRNVGLRTQR